VALVALFVALGGTAVAARHYLITSTSQIKPSVLKLLRGLSQLGQITRVTGPVVTVQAGGINDSIAECPSGYDVVSGGYYATVAPGGYVYQDEPVSPHVWWAGVNTSHSAEAAKVQAVALCAPTGRAVSVASLRAQSPTP
jgi:hypothetical protein